MEGLGASWKVRRPVARTSATIDALHLCNGLVPRRDGGMVPSILGFTGALARFVGDVTIVTQTPSDREALQLPPGVHLLGPRKHLDPFIRQARVVHLHGLWQAHTRQGASLARRYRVPYLMTAHGMAEPWALRHKFLKKRVYTALVEGRNLRRASCLHALSRPEIDHLRSLAPKVPICLVPNGVDPTPFDELPARSLLESTHPELINKFIILFLGRLHVKKGLDLLAQAVARVVHHHPNLHLLIAGADEGAKSPLVQLAQYLGIADRLTFLGHVADESARLAWGAADAFVLPSYSEGFSMAVLEALAARLPVVITDSCHFPELAAADGGITAPPTPEGITQALRNLLERSPEERAALAARGRALVESRYTWNRQAERLAQVYNWLLEGGPAPDVVIEPA